jgi:hypothetical protein
LVWGRTSTRRHETSASLPRPLVFAVVHSLVATVRVRFPEYMNGDLVKGFVRVRRTK